MTKTPLSQTVDEGRNKKKSLKPVVEKKRRDRINQSLAELRRLLLTSTSDPRLQNPKIEKAEILDLAVEYLQKWTDRKNMHDDRLHIRAPLVRLALPESVAPPPPPPPPPLPPLPPPPPLLSVEAAGFQQCVAQLSGYMHKITPAQRASLLERLRHHHTEGRQPRVAPGYDHNAASSSSASSRDAICTSDSKDEPPGFLFPAHSPFQPHSCSTPCHDYLSPPPSPWYSPPFPTYASSSPFPSFVCHFSSAPSLSPPSSNTSFFSFSPSLPHCGPSGLPVPLLTVVRAPPNPAHQEERAPNSSSSSPVWRPWFR